MTSNKSSIKKAPRHENALNINIKEPLRDLGAIDVGALNTKLNLENLQTELTAKMETLNTAKISATTVERFLTPIQGYVQTVIGGSADGVVGWWDRMKAARAQRRDEEISRLFLEAQAEMRADNWTLAIKKLDRVLKLDRKNYLAMYLKAICLSAIPNLEAAIKLATEGTRDCPDPELQHSFTLLLEELHEMLVYFPVVIGITAMTEQEYRIAITCFDSSLELRPNQPEVIFHKALCQLFEGELVEARASVKAARRLSPSATLQTQLQELLEVIGLREKLVRIMERMTQEDYRGALQLLDDPSLKDAGSQIFFLRAQCQLQLGRRTDAEGTLRTLAHEDNSPETREVIAEFRQRMILEELMENATAALEHQNWDGALKSLRAVESRLPQSEQNQPFVQFHIAMCELKSHNINAARLALRKGRLGSPEGELKKAYDMFDRYL
jgi:tetratricopeptide (TPR) repeat protein